MSTPSPGSFDRQALLDQPLVPPTREQQLRVVTRAYRVAEAEGWQDELPEVLAMLLAPAERTYKRRRGH